MGDFHLDFVLVPDVCGGSGSLPAETIFRRDERIEHHGYVYDAAPKDWAGDGAVYDRLQRTISSRGSLD